MGYLVVTTGRLLLPAGLERQALTVAEHRMAARPGSFGPDDAEVIDELSDLAAYAGVALTRDGDWLTVTTDLTGDPTWSEQAEEFYRSLSGFVREGAVHLRAQDGTTWSYAYSAQGMESSTPRTPDQAPPPNDPVVSDPEPPTAQPSASSTEPPLDPPSPGGTALVEPPERPEPPGSQEPDPPPPTDSPGTSEPPGAERDDFIDYPGRRPGAPPASTPPPPPPARPNDGPAAPPGPSGPTSYRDVGWSGPSDDDPPPAPPGRVALMTVALVVGVLLIIGLALLASGL